ncbi:MAG: GPW/gp25 family protein [Clostridiales Family XIII bacterium]|jgi:phage baseplate assembly protein W|nr:GPW/gp25 family protein [Clostridiales Family XIII bacterium]
MEKYSHLGSGMKFPPQVNKATGRFAVSGGAQSVKESVYLILMTGAGERWLAPAFGSRLSGYAFMDTNLTSLSMMSNDLRDTLLDQEPRIADVEIGIDAETRDDCLIVNIAYRLNESNTKENLVFPFYLNTVKGEAPDDYAE